MSKGDFVTVYVRNGIELTPFNVTASQNGRKVDLETSTKEVIATEVTRGGTVVRRIEFQRADVVAIESQISE